MFGQNFMSGKILLFLFLANFGVWPYFMFGNNLCSAKFYVHIIKLYVKLKFMFVILFV